MNFDFGKIITNTLQIIWKHKVLFGIYILTLLTSFALLGSFFGSMILFADDTLSKVNDFIAIGLVVLFILLAFVSIVLRTLGLSAVTLGVIRAEQAEGSLKFIDLLSDSWKYFWRQLGVYLIIQLSIGLIFTIFLLFYFAATIVTMGIASLCLQPIFILITPLTFLVMGVLEAAQVSVITENLGVQSAVKRGIAIVREHVWKYLIVTLMIYFGTTILTSFLSIPISIPFMGIAFFVESGAKVSDSLIVIMIALILLILFPIMIFTSAISQTLLKVSLGLTYLRLPHKDENQVIFGETKT